MRSDQAVIYADVWMIMAFFAVNHDVMDGILGPAGG